MLDSQLVQTLGLVLVHSTWQGLLIGLLFAAGRLALKDTTAVSRYNWATLCLILMALAPVITFTWLAGGTGNHAVAGLTTMSDNVRAGVASAVSQSSGWSLSAFLPAIVGLWFCGVAIMSIRLSAGWWYVRQLRRHADYRIPPAMQARLEQVIEQLNMARQVSLAFSNQIAGPMLVGVFRPLILVPTGLVNGLSPRQMEMVLAHELAHLQRADHLVNLFQNIVETLLFYHPVVRWISGEIRAERELASDEQVARLTGDRITYAETLLKLEKARGNRPQFAIGMADHQLLKRVRHLLAPRPRQPGSAISGTALLSVLLVSVITALASTGLKALSDTDPTEEHLQRPLVESTATPDNPAAIEYPAGESHDHAEAPEPPIEVTTSTTMLTVPEAAPVDQSIKAIGSEPAEWPEPVEATELIEPAESVEPAEPIRLAANDLPAHPIETDPASDETATLAPADEEPEQMESDAGTAPLPEQPALDLPLREPMQLALLQPMPAAEIRGGTLLERTVPAYPAVAVRQGREGRAEVRLKVDRDGRVVDVEIVEETPAGLGFGQAAVQAVEQWRFEPFTRNGEAIRHEIQTGFDFTDPPACERITGTRLSRC
jgi:bla regulator protein blaR1